MPTEGERLATVEQVLRDIRSDLQDFKGEQTRARERMHAAEGTLRGLVMTNEQEARHIRARQEKLQRRLSLLTVVIAAGALVEPFLYKAAGL